MQLGELIGVVIYLQCSLCAYASISYDPADYLEVYPDPRDPAVLGGRTPLHFALIQSLGGPLSLYDGSGAVAGVKVALDRINNDITLLPGYTLHYILADSLVSRLGCHNVHIHACKRDRVTENSKVHFDMKWGKVLCVAQL